MFLLQLVEEDGLRGHFTKKNVDIAHTRKRGMGLRWKAPEAPLTADASLKSCDMGLPHGPVRSQHPQRTRFSAAETTRQLLHILSSVFLFTRSLSSSHDPNIIHHSRHFNNQIRHLKFNPLTWFPRQQPSASAHPQDALILCTVLVPIFPTLGRKLRTKGEKISL